MRIRKICILFKKQNYVYEVVSIAKNMNEHKMFWHSYIQFRTAPFETKHKSQMKNFSLYSFQVNFFAALI